MNEFVAKKLGEVLAFNRLESDTIAKGRSALVAALGEEKLVDIEDRNRVHSEAVMKASTDAGMIDTTLTKADATLAKVTKMRDLYIGDNWGNATELMEWSGFAEGATIAHWTLIRGAAEGMNDNQLLTLADEAVTWHYELLELSESELATDGQDKAQE